MGQANTPETVGGDFVSFVIEFLHHVVIGVLVSHEESTANGAVVGIGASLEHFAVIFVILGVDRVVHADDDHLRSL